MCVNLIVPFDYTGPCWVYFWGNLKPWWQVLQPNRHDRHNSTNPGLTGYNSTCHNCQALVCFSRAVVRVSGKQIQNLARSLPVRIGPHRNNFPCLSHNRHLLYRYKLGLCHYRRACSWRRQDFRSRKWNPGRCRQVQCRCRRRRFRNRRRCWQIQCRRRRSCTRHCRRRRKI